MTWPNILNRPHTLFLLLALLYGALYAATMPPLRIKDEIAHFARIVEYSQRAWQGHGIVGKDFTDFVDQYSRDDRVRNKFVVAIKNSADPEQVALPPMTGIFYSPAPYLTAIPPVWLARQLDMSTIHLYYLCKLVLLLSSVALVYFAIKITPVLKWPLFLLALLPPLIFTRSSVSGDQLLLGYTAIFMALLLDSLFLNRPVTSSRILGLAIFSVLLSLSKNAYFLLPGLFFLLPYRLFASRRQYMLGLVSVVIVPVLLNIGWLLLVRHTIFILHVDRPTHPAEEAQLAYVFSDPFTTLKILLEGASRAFEDLPSLVGLPNYALNVAALLALFFTPEAGGKNIRPWQRLLCLMLCATTLLVICLMLYVNWTPLHSQRLIGFQIRYFVPMILPMALITSYTAPEKTVRIISLCALLLGIFLPLWFCTRL